MNPFSAFLKMTRAALIAFLRDRPALVWSFFLPITLTLVFGSLFGNAGQNETPHFDVGVVREGSPSPTTAWIPEALDKVPVFTLHHGSLPAETEALRAGERRLVFVFPADFGERFASDQTIPVRLLYDPTQPPEATQAILGIARQTLSVMDRHLSGAPERLSPQEEALPRPTLLQGRAPRALDYILPGLFGMTAMQLGLMTALPLITLRERGILRRFQATPLPRGVIVASQVALRMLIGSAQTLVLLVLGRVIFDFRMSCSPLVVLALGSLGVLIFIGIGAVIASVARTQEAGMSLVQIINLPLMLFSGLLIPSEMLPDAVRPIMAVLPTTYLGDALRQVMLAAPGMHTLSFDLGVLALYLVISLALAAWRFRWE
jgi:ABC-2 type transport system permease protein